MLTILHKEPNGYESLHSAKWTSYYPAEKRLVSGMAVMGQVNADGTQHDTFSNGVVYVMNENGKTVAKYDFD